MNRSRLAIIVVLTLALCATSAFAGQKFKCNANGRVFTVTGDLSGFEAVLTWIGGNSDNDLVAFSEFLEELFPPDGIVAVGFGIENRFERIAFGTLPGDSVGIAVFKSSGRNTNCILNINASIQASGGRIRVRDRGSLTDLALTDPRYAELLERVQAQRESKRRIVR